MPMSVIKRQFRQKPPGTAPAPAADDPQNDKNDAEQPKPVDLRTDTEKERDHGVF